MSWGLPCSRPTDERFGALFDAFRVGFSIEEVHSLTHIAPFFLVKIRNIVNLEKKIAAGAGPGDILLARQYGFTIGDIAGLTAMSPEDIHDISGDPTYKMVDTCAAEFPAQTPYFYSTWDDECEIPPNERQKVLILGSGGIRIGQGIEFDYCTGHAVKAVREENIEVHIVNNNPETVGRACACVCLEAVGKPSGSASTAGDIACSRSSVVGRDSYWDL